jgi:hypothetical protein
MVDLWNKYNDDSGSPIFGSKRYYLRLGTRWNTSLSSVSAKSIDVKFGEAHALRYDESHRYLLAKDLTYDMILSIFDVNTSSVVVARLTVPLGKADLEKMRSAVAGMRMKNIELRLIGLQNKADLLLGSMTLFQTYLKGALAEVDLYGNERRHIAIDTKTGTTYNLLLNNIIYKPGELTSTLTKEAFAERRSKFHFV